MRALVQREYGSADVLSLQDVERPDVGDDEVMVRVCAASVDRGAWHLMTGRPLLMRIAGVGFRRPKARIPGTKMSGRVEAVGPNVARVQPGDEVYGICRGAYAEFACASENKIAPKPARLTFEGAAAVPHGGFAALQALRDHGNLQPGQRVLIIGASGAVGSCAVQIAKAFGAEVTGVSSTAKMDLVRSLGADHVIDYTHADPVDGAERYDLVLDIGGGRSVAKLRRGAHPCGTLVIVGGEAGGQLTGGLNRQLWAHVLSLFLRQKLGTFIAKERADDLLTLKELIDSGKLLANARSDLLVERRP